MGGSCLSRTIRERKTAKAGLIGRCRRRYCDAAVTAGGKIAVPGCVMFLATTLLGIFAVASGAMAGLLCLAPLGIWGLIFLMKTFGDTAGETESARTMRDPTEANRRAVMARGMRTVFDSEKPKVVEVLEPVLNQGAGALTEPTGWYVDKNILEGAPLGNNVVFARGQLDSRYLGVIVAHQLVRIHNGDGHIALALAQLKHHRTTSLTPKIGWLFGVNKSFGLIIVWRKWAITINCSSTCRRETKCMPKDLTYSKMRP